MANLNPPVPLHRQVREKLRLMIAGGFHHGDRFPGESELMTELAVSQGTVRRALGELVAEGLLIRRVPAGTFVQKEGRPRPVAVILPKWQSMFISSWREALAMAAEAHGAELHFHFTESAMDLDALGDWLTRGRFQGALLIGNDGALTESIARLLHRLAIPTTSFEKAIASGPAFCLDEDAAMSLSVDHLAALGHRRLAFVVNEPGEAESIGRRLAAFTRATAGRGLPGVVVDGKVPFWTDSHDAAWGLMPRAAATGATAFIFASDAGAYAALKWYRRQGVSVPGQVSVMGFNDDAANRFVDPPLTSVAQPVAEMAARFMTGMADSPVTGPVLFKPRLVIRESTGPAPKE